MAHPPPSILVAESDEIIRDLLTHVLHRDGHRVVAIEDGADLLDYLGMIALSGHLFEVPDLILSDVRMPRGSRADLLAGLQRSAQRVPFILMTAFVDQALLAEAARHGAAAVLGKPFDLDRLRWLVRDTLA